MIGDLWESPKTGKIYRVGPKGTDWEVVGQAQNPLWAVFGSAALGLGAFLLMNLWLAVMVGVIGGAVVMYLPMALPFSVPLVLLGCVIVAIRALVRRRRFTPVLVAWAFGGVFVVAALANAVFWYDNVDFPPYLALAGAPVMVVGAAALGVVAIIRGRARWSALFFPQAVIFALPYLFVTGWGTDDILAYDNLLSAAFWIAITTLAIAFFTPRQGALAGAPEEA